MSWSVRESGRVHRQAEDAPGHDDLKPDPFTAHTPAERSHASSSMARRSPMPHLFARIELDDAQMARLEAQRLPTEDLGETSARILSAALTTTDTASHVPGPKSPEPLPDPTPRSLPEAESLFEIAVLVGGEWSTLAWTALPSDADVAATAFLARRSFLEHAQIWQGGQVVAEYHKAPE
jgi:hypothetical protein